MDSPPLGDDHRRVLPGGVEDDDLVLGVSEDGVLYLALDGKRLAGAGLARDEAHGARQALAVAEHEVGGLLVLAVVAAARLRELLGREGHLYGDLSGGHHAGDLHVVVPERQHRVQALALPEVERVGLDGVSARGRYDLHHLVVQLLARGRVGVDEARVDVEALVAVLQVVEEVFGLLLGVLELGGEDLEVVALLHRAHLLVDYLLVHPCDALLHEGDGL